MNEAAKKDAQQFANKAKDAAQSAADTARDAASHLGQAASSAANTVGKKAEEWTAGAGSRVESLGETVRNQGPHSGMLGRANEAVAGGLENAGEYIKDKNLSGMMGDITDLVKRNPIPALLVGLGVGYLVGRAMRS